MVQNGAKIIEDNTKDGPVLVGLKYCGGCQIRYDCKAALDLIREQCSRQTVFEPIREDKTYDYILVLNGCQAQCADNTKFLTRNGFMSLYQWIDPMDAVNAIRQIEETKKTKNR